MSARGDVDPYFAPMASGRAVNPTTRSDARLVREPLSSCLTPPQALVSLRDEPFLVGLIGDWAGGGAIIASAPVVVAHPLDDPFSLIDELPHVSSPVPSAVGGGWFGYLGYQLGSRLERLSSEPPRPVPLPPFSLSYYDHVLHYDGTAWWFEALWTEARSEYLEGRLDWLRRHLGSPPPDLLPYHCGRFRPWPGRGAHCAIVSRALEYINAGDIFQVNLCQRLEARFTGHPLDLFATGVQRLQPPFAAFLEGKGWNVASFSPELFLQRTGRRVRSSPIKGTHQSDRSTRRSADSRRALLSSAKDRAENLMIVDLIRSDLGKLCRAGSVDVPFLTRPEEHPGVWHLVSDVVGELEKDARDSDLLGASFPPGSVTGAPKIRAMDIINELEATAREVYTGAIGYISPVAGMELNVAIRTFEFGGNRVWLGAGGGIVADSDPETEYAECLLKAGPLIEAIAGEPPIDTPGRPLRPTFLEQPKSDRPDPKLGIFETLLVLDGIPIQLTEHVRRLAVSARVLYGQELAQEVAHLAAVVAARQTSRAVLRLTAIPGAAGPIRVELECEPYEGPDPADPRPARLLPVRIPEGLGAHKWRDRRLLHGLAKTLERGPDEALLLVANDGRVLEAEMANLFLVTGETLRTPPLDGRILAGVARQAVMRAAAARGITTSTEPLTLQDLARCDDCFVTSSLRGIQPVGECRGIASWGPGPLATALRQDLCREWSAAPRAAAPPTYTRSWHGRSEAASGNRRSASRSILIIDNYDSFVYNLAQYCLELGFDIKVARNDEVTRHDITSLRPSAIVLSPGPCSPREAGVSTDVVARFGSVVPILGVCLGHQCIAEAFGGRVVRAPQVVHGKASLIEHDGRGAYEGAENPLLAMRYHSLVVEPSSLPDDLIATAWTSDDVLMGIRHRRYPVEGVQFHPESILTESGHVLISNFLTGFGVTASRAGATPGTSM